MQRSTQRKPIAQARSVIMGGLARPRTVGVDLAGRAGELVRLRWGVTGPGNALARWHGARVLSTAPRLEPPSVPIGRVAPDRTGGLGQPDVIVMDIAMPRLDGLAATRQIAADCPAVRVLVLTAHEDEEHVIPLVEQLIAE